MHKFIHEWTVWPGCVVVRAKKSHKYILLPLRFTTATTTTSSLKYRKSKCNREYFKTNNAHTHKTSRRDRASLWPHNGYSNHHHNNNININKATYSLCAARTNEFSAIVFARFTKYYFKHFAFSAQQSSAENSFELLFHNIITKYTYTKSCKVGKYCWKYGKKWTMLKWNEQIWTVDDEYKSIKTNKDTHYASINSIRT